MRETHFLCALELPFNALKRLDQEKYTNFHTVLPLPLPLLLPFPAVRYGLQACRFWQACKAHSE